MFAGLREGSFYNNKEVNHQQDIIIINIYTPKKGTSKYMKHNVIIHRQHNCIHDNPKRYRKELYKLISNLPT